MLCERKDIKIMEAELCPNHVHMLISIPPKMSVSVALGYIKGKSTQPHLQGKEKQFKLSNNDGKCSAYDEQFGAQSSAVSQMTLQGIIKLPAKLVDFYSLSFLVL